jgi:hypothetical protein
LPKPLSLADLERRLKNLTFQLLEGPDEHLKTFARVLPAYFPHPYPRKIAYPFPKYYKDLQLLPTAVVEDILLHLFLSYDEEVLFWADEEPVH